MPDHRTIRSLGFEAPGKPYFFFYEELPPSEGHVRLDALYSGFSAGTELTFLKDTWRSGVLAKAERTASPQATSFQPAMATNLAIPLTPSTSC